VTASVQMGSAIESQMRNVVFVREYEAKEERKRRKKELAYKYRWRMFELSNAKQIIYTGRKPPILLIRRDNTRHNYP
jgi:hypothetical protein